MAGLRLEWAALACLGGVSLAVWGCEIHPPNHPTLTSRVDQVSLERVHAAPGASYHVVWVRGERREFALWAPPGGLSGDHPVILFLHGATRHLDADQLARCFIEPQLAALSPVMVAPLAPRGRGGEWWRGEEASFALGLLRAVVLSWPVNDRQVVVMGYSNGGLGAWVMARVYPQYFTAAIPMAFNHTVVGGTSVPVFAIQGQKDELFGSAQVEREVAALQRQGFHVELRVRPRGSHFAPCSYGQELAEARDWLVHSVW